MYECMKMKKRRKGEKQQKKENIMKIKKMFDQNGQRISGGNRNITDELCWFNFCRKNDAVGHLNMDGSIQANDIS